MRWTDRTTVRLARDRGGKVELDVTFVYETGRENDRPSSYTGIEHVGLSGRPHVDPGLTGDERIRLEALMRDRIERRFA